MRAVLYEPLLLIFQYDNIQDFPVENREERRECIVFW